MSGKCGHRLGPQRYQPSIRSSFVDPFRDPAALRDRQLAADALTLVGLHARRDTTASALSSGDQRRLEIARAIVSRPRVLLMDEPMSGISLDEEHKLLALMQDLNANVGAHDVSDRAQHSICVGHLQSTFGHVRRKNHRRRCPKDGDRRTRGARIYFGERESALR